MKREEAEVVDQADSAITSDVSARRDAAENDLTGKLDRLTQRRLKALQLIDRALVIDPTNPSLQQLKRAITQRI